MGHSSFILNLPSNSCSESKFCFYSPKVLTMACTGVNEYAEGCRKQRVLDRSAYSRQMMMEGLIPMDVSYRPERYAEEEEPGYMRKMGSPPGITTPVPRQQRQYYGTDTVTKHSPTAIDRLRRDAVRRQQMFNYSAKIPNRFSSTNYNQQW